MCCTGRGEGVCGKISGGGREGVGEEGGRRGRGKEEEEEEEEEEGLENGGERE